MAILVGKADEGLALSERYLNRLRHLRKQAAENNPGEADTSDRDAPRVFFQISDQDLYTVSDGHLIGQAIELCGGVNLFADVPIPVPLANLEAVLGGKPDIIFITRTPDAPDSPWRSKWEQLLGAVVQVIPIDPNLISRPSFRMLDGIEFMCSAIQTAG
jgi:ABC-type Fe3+-hydroxamate transport system substrate-binding protein